MHIEDFIWEGDTEDPNFIRTVNLALQELPDDFFKDTTVTGQIVIHGTYGKLNSEDQNVNLNFYPQEGDLDYIKIPDKAKNICIFLDHCEVYFTLNRINYAVFRTKKKFNEVRESYEE